MSGAIEGGEDPVARRRKGEAFARKTVEKTWADSTLADLSHKLPAFDQCEIKVGRLLGKGSFGAVFEIKAFNLDASQQENKKNLPDARSFLSEHCLREDGSSDARYAVKRLTQKALNEHGRYVQAIMDAAIETRVLSNINDHPHICKLRAVGASRDPYSQDYVLVLDRLYDTLVSRIMVWSEIIKKSNSFFMQWFTDCGGKKLQEMRENQLKSALQLCAAVDHLHQHNIIYRDLKPENCGYDIRDDIKIFDFGLAKELRRAHKLDDGSGMYKLSAMTGSPRYMAPEVANGLPYNITCDSHSFAILFHEMYSTKLPFDEYTLEQMRNQVWNGTERPKIPANWPASIRNMLKNSWCVDNTERWTISQIMGVLYEECSQMSDIALPEPHAKDDVESVVSSSSKTPKTAAEMRAAFKRRRSTFVFRESKFSQRKLSSLEREASSANLTHQRSSVMDQLMSGSQLLDLGSSDEDETDFASDLGDSDVDAEMKPLTVVKQA